MNVAYIIQLMTFDSLQDLKNIVEVFLARKESKWVEKEIPLSWRFLSGQSSEMRVQNFLSP